MKIVSDKDILNLFPGAEIINDSQDHKDYLIVNTRLGKIAFPKQELTKREHALINLLATKQFADRTNNPWKKYLLDQGKQPEIAEQVRFLYFKINNLSKDLRASWAELAQSFFTNSRYFWLTDELFIIIDFDCRLSKEDFLGIISTIDNDFDCRTYLQLGLIWKKEDKLPEIFSEEKEIFEAKYQKLDQVSTIPERALIFYLNKGDSNLILNAYQQKFEQSDNYAQLIVELYRVGGNLSKASKRLFLHRNTLEYRLDKLQNDYGLNLRKMDDLVFALMALRSK